MMMDGCLPVRIKEQSSADYAAYSDFFMGLGTRHILN
jgi:hypothetical protein